VRGADRRFASTLDRRKESVTALAAWPRGGNGSLDCDPGNSLPAWRMLPRPPPPAGPSPRQAEYLAFIRAFTDRWQVPPSFEEIGRHFMTTAPSVNSMVKTLEARGFLTRVPGRPRTLRVIWAEAPAVRAEPPASRPASGNADVKAATRMASLVIERLVPALKGASEQHLRSALEAVSGALETVCLASGAPADEREEAHATLLRVASIAQGRSPETRPGRKLPGWRKPR
jgi:hypothetical protein